MIFLIYFSGIITTLSIGAAILFYYLHKDQKSLNEKLLLENESLKEFKSSKESIKRLARFETTGWHYSKETNNPNKETWDVTFELRECAVSVDESEIKFEVVSVSSANTNDGWGLDNYDKWFKSKYKGGWVKLDDPNLEWITTTSKMESRDIKLKGLGIE